MLNRIREEWNWAQDEAYWNNEKCSIVDFLIYFIEQTFIEEKCRIFGHDLIEESHAGPDSGWICFTCKRCGYSSHITLY